MNREAGYAAAFAVFISVLCAASAALLLAIVVAIIAAALATWAFVHPAASAAPPHGRQALPQRRSVEARSAPSCLESAQ